MKSEADRILFRVIPKDKTVALKNIRDLLNIYIDFIDNKEIEIYEDYNNLAVSQLKANVLHLKSQLILAQTIIEQKQITIDLLKNTKVIMTKQEKNEIELFGGMVRLKEFEYHGVILNPVKILEFLKRRNKN